MCIGPRYADNKFWRYVLQDSFLRRVNAIVFHIYFRYARICHVVLEFDADEVNNAAMDFCDCRIANHNCNTPLNTCLKIDIEGKTDYKKLGYEMINEFHLKNINMKRSGLLLLRVESLNRYIELCHCCSCCCIPLEIQRLFILSREKYRAIGPSDRIPNINREMCNNCGACYEFCPLSIDHDSRVNNQLKNCLGCGICASKCPKQAIKMIKRQINHNISKTSNNKSKSAYYFSTIYLLFQFAFYKLHYPSSVNHKD